jgi:hypothetical protein
MFVVLISLMLVFVGCTLALVCCSLVQYLRLLRRLKREERLIDWEELIASPEFLHGTVIINCSVQPGRIWWVDHPIPEPEATIVLDTTALLVRRPKLRTRCALLQHYPSLRIWVVTASPWYLRTDS